MFKYVLSLLLMLVGACSEEARDISASNIYERALEKKGRFKGDRERDEQRKSAQVLEFSGVEPGMVVVDLLGGGGFYAELLSDIVGEQGRVFLQNNSLFLRFTGEELEARLKGGRLPNVVRLDSEFADMQLPTDVDLMVMSLNYHDIYVPREDPVIMANRDEFFSQVSKSLKSKGKLLVIDHAAERGSGKAAAATMHRIDEDFAKKDIESAGFKFIASLDVLRNSKDDYTKDIWVKGIMHKTDRFIYLFEKME